jgi:hypothetical protein
MSSSACLPARTAKRFTITTQSSRQNKGRITVTDSVASITTSYTYTTAQELVKELASAVGMLVCTPETMAEMLRAQHLLMADVYD